MIPVDPLPFSRPFRVASLSPEGSEVAVEATREECAAVAEDLGLPAVHALSALFVLKGGEQRVAVTGRVTASVARTCVVTLDVFDSVLEENVQVDFAAEGAHASRAGGGDRDPPDPIVDGRIDLGALSVEFVALGLDPYPRKPGGSFAAQSFEEQTASPFGGLARLKGREGQGL